MAEAQSVSEVCKSISAYLNNGIIQNEGVFFSSAEDGFTLTKCWQLEKRVPGLVTHISGDGSLSFMELKSLVIAKMLDKALQPEGNAAELEILRQMEALPSKMNEVIRPFIKPASPNGWIR